MADMNLNEALEILNGNIFTVEDEVLQEALRVATENGYDDLVRNTNDKLALFERDNGLEENDVQIYASNNDVLSRESERYTYNQFINEPDNAEIVETINNTDIADGGKKDSVILGDDKKQEYLHQLFQGAKIKAEIALSGSQDFYDAKKESKKKLFKDEVQTIFLTDFARTAIASRLDKPTHSEQKIGSADYMAYVARQARKAQEIFKDITESGKKITIHVDSILSSVADSAIRVENYVRGLQRKASKASGAAKETWTKLASKIQAKKNRLEEKAKLISDNRYEIYKNVKGSLKDNAYKIGTNIAANIGMGAWMGASAAAGGTVAPALIAYGAYHAASSWVWPVVKEYRKINRERREKGEEKLGFKKALKEAWKSTTTGKNKKKYLISGIVNTAVGVGLMGWGAHISDAANVAKDAASAANDAATAAMAVAGTRTTVRVTKTAAATGAQLIDAAVNKEKSTAYAAVLGGALSYVMIGDGTGNHAEAELPRSVETDNITDNVNADAETADTALDSADSVTEAANESTEVDTTDSADNAQLSDEQIETENDLDEFPREYSPDMGISERQYNILVSTTEGTLKSATGEEITLDRAYSNLTDEAMEHFSGKTREEVMYKFNRLYGFMRKAYDAGNGTLRETPSGADYLEQKFSGMNLNLDDAQMSQLVAFAEQNTYADKATLVEGLNERFDGAFDKRTVNSLAMAIHSNQRFYQNAEEMEALTKLLGCGDTLTAEQAAAANALLDRTDEILSSGNSKNNNYLTGLSLSKGCEDDDGQWKIGTVSAPEKVVETVPAVEPEPAVEPAPVTEPEPVAEPEPERRPLLRGENVRPVLNIAPTTPQNLELEEVHVPEPEPVAEPEPETKKLKVRQALIDKYSDLETGNASAQETLSDEKSQRMIDSYNRKHNIGR